MSDKKTKLQAIMDEISRGATSLVADPETIKALQDEGLPITSRFITYEEYVDDLFKKRKTDAVEKLRLLPKIDDSVADAVVSEIYEEIRSSYAFGAITSTIINSILLLEYSMRAALYKKRLGNDPNARWDDLEKLQMGGLINQLFKTKIIKNSDDRDLLKDFSDNFRNPYLHINIKKMSENIVIAKLPGVNVGTQEAIEMTDVKVSEHRFLWFSAKRFFDKYHVQSTIDFCVDWTNKLLKEPKNE